MRALILGAHLRREDVEPIAEAVPVGELFLSAMAVADDQPIGDRELLLKVAETRERRGGAFPQINVLLNRDEESALQGLHAELNERYASEGIAVALTGPWPPYSFAQHV